MPEAAPVVPAAAATPPPVDPAVAAPAAIDPAAAAAAEPVEKRTPWFQARIDAVTREKWEATRRAEAAETRAAAAEARLAAPAAAPASAPPSAAPSAPAPASAAPAAAMSPAEIDRLVAERAQSIAGQRDFDTRCNTIYNQGLKDVPNFKEAVDNFQMFGGLGAHKDFLDTITLLPEGNGAQVLAHLGTNLDEANRILTIPNPRQQALEVSKLSATLKKGPGVSQAPAPVQPTSGGAANPSPAPDADGKFKSHADYMAWKEKNWKK